jgi:hypothetical protein
VHKQDPLSLSTSQGAGDEGLASMYVEGGEEEEEFFCYVTPENRREIRVVRISEVLGFRCVCTLGR